MTCKCKKAREAAELAAHEAVEHGSNALEEVVNYVVPRAVHASRQAADVVVPAFEDARDRIAPKVSEVVYRVQPTLTQAYETVSDKVQHEVYPKLQELWDEANENPTVVEASRRGRTALAALKGEDLVSPEPVAMVAPRKKRGIAGKIFTVLGIAALLGAIVIAVRTVLGSSDDGWSPQEPIRPGQDEEAGWGENPFGDDLEADPDVSAAAAEASEQAEADMVAEGGPAAEHNYGEGSYVGTEPPEGFTIKGNERSMKYHTREAAGYDRTNADVWFNSEEAAQQAGFTRALR